MSLLAPLKARSHSQDVAGKANISKAPALEGREGFVYIWLTPLGYRVKLLSGVSSSTLLVRAQVCVISFPNVPALS
jgi:hypothetical protein